MRRFAKVDANQQAVVKALRSIGCNVLSLAPLGSGCPDLLVQYRERITLLEIKDGSKPPGQQKLTPAELEFHRVWGGFGNVHVVNNTQDAIQFAVVGGRL